MLVVLNRGSANRSVEGGLYYGAVYSEAFTASRVSDHYDILVLDDDEPAASAALLTKNTTRSFAVARASNY
jgi:hypothetical protein